MSRLLCIENEEVTTHLETLWYQSDRIKNLLPGISFINPYQIILSLNFCLRRVEKGNIYSGHVGLVVFFWWWKIENKTKQTILSHNMELRMIGESLIFDLLEVLGTTSKHILPNGGEKW